MSNVREIHLIGQGVVADMANLKTQVKGLIEAHDGSSVPLMPGEIYVRPVSDPQFPEGTNLLISVNRAGSDATCRRFVIDKIGAQELPETPAEAAPVTMSLAEGGPVHFLSPEGTLDRIVYRRT